MEEELRAILMEDLSIDTLVSGRIEWGANAQGRALPAIVLNVINDQARATMEAAGSLSQGIVQVDCYAKTYGAAKTLSRLVRSALDGYQGGGFQGIFHSGSRDSREGGTNEQDRPYRVSLDFNTNWTNT